MSWLVSAVLCAVGGLLALFAGVLLLQVVAATTGRQRPGSGGAPLQAASGRMTVLVPAHNESAGLLPTLAHIRQQLAPGDRLLVVADNCSDDTAAQARAAGADVVERHDAQQRGKGYALDFGVRALAASGPAPDLLVIIDADCLLAPDALSVLRHRCLQTGRPVQALYLMKLAGPATLSRRFAEFAWRVKNRVRPRGSGRLGWPCQLMGTGMALPWNSLRHVQLANGDLVEDMRLGVELALVGQPPLFAEEALVWSHFPESSQAEASQRRRWEHGHLGLIADLAPPLLRHALARRNAPALGMALDLAVPPLAFLVLSTLMLGLAVAGLGWGLAVPWRGAAALAGLAGGGVLLAVLLAWWHWGRDLIHGRELLLVPVYIAKKVPVYVAFWLARQRDWVRTDRQ